LNRRNNVFLVPNAALRWKPALDQVAPEFREALSRSGEGKEKAKEGQQAAAPGEPANRADLWRPEGETVRPLAVRVGLSDGTLTEVAGEQLADGLMVVTGVQQQASAKTDTSNPFTPSFSRGGGTAGGGRPR